MTPTLNSYSPQRQNVNTKDPKKLQRGISWRKEKQFEEEISQGKEERRERERVQSGDKRISCRLRLLLQVRDLTAGTEAQPRPGDKGISAAVWHRKGRGRQEEAGLTDTISCLAQQPFCWLGHCRGGRCIQPDFRDEDSWKVGVTCLPMQPSSCPLQKYSGRGAIR